MLVAIPCIGSGNYGALRTDNILYTGPHGPLALTILYTGPHGTLALTTGLILSSKELLPDYYY